MPAMRPIAKDSGFGSDVSLLDGNGDKENEQMVALEEEESLLPEFLSDKHLQ
jgi:hypothetical protein